MMRSYLPLLICLACLVCLAGCEGDPTPEQPPRQGCESGDCHGPAGQRGGIEIAHRGAQLSCTDCHGGDATATTATDAHVTANDDWLAERGGYIRNLSVNDLDRVDPDYLRFINPGDYRVAGRSCGSASSAAAGGTCHQAQVDSAPTSVMSTFVGHFDVPRFQAGMQGQDAVVGARAGQSLNAELPSGAVASITQATPPPVDAPRDQISTLMDHYLTKNCTTCHAWSYGANDRTGNYRSSGCASCHMVYNREGSSESEDPSRAPGPPHPAKHELTTAIPSEQCEHCHYQGARIGLAYRGVVEWGFDQPAPYPNTGEELHGRPVGFYLNGGSDTPPDLHYTAGMVCADCHVGRDVHGDGNIYSSAKFQVSIRCENCHGNIDRALQAGQAVAPLVAGGREDPECAPPASSDGHVLNCNGDPLKNVEVNADGRVWLERRDGGGRLEVPQIHDMLAGDASPVMRLAMGRNADTGVSHTETMECHSCHSGWRQYCFGCHVSMDYGVDKIDNLTGLATPGAETASRSFVSLDLYFIGQNHRGKLASFCPSMQAFLSANDSSTGTTFFENKVRRSADGKVGFNWAVDAPHTTSRAPQPCSRCHADANDDCSTDNARQTYGFGTGRYMFTDSDGTSHDLTQLLDPAGNPIVNFSHAGQGPVPIGAINRALAVCAP